MPESRQALDPIEAKELRQLARLEVVELEIHAKGIAAQGKKDALAQAEHARVTPDQINAEGHDAQGQEPAQQVEPEGGQHRR